MAAHKATTSKIAFLIFSNYILKFFFMASKTAANVLLLFYNKLVRTNIFLSQCFSFQIINCTFARKLQVL
ncbi:hypothetical protein HMPREF9419_2270 [Prevotella nigrescens ATCC 33563]|nr:hypothetical protein HMPREF9419_2270 [Prevotella nigrescens ATCC 33563]